MFANNIPVGFADTRVGKLRKRIHLPNELLSEVHEERHRCARYVGANSIEVNPVDCWIANYNHKTGWSVVWMEPRIAILQAASVEVILRRHKKLGNFILFRVWKQEGQQ